MVRLLPLVTVVGAVVLLFTGSGAAQPSARWLFIIDDYHLDFVNTGRTRDQLRRTASALILPGDTFALHCTGPSPASFDWTSDRSALDTAIRFVTGHGLKFRDQMAIAAGTQPDDRRAELTVAKVVGILDRLDRSAGVGIVYVSNGYRELPDALRNAVDRTRVPIFAIDPRLTEGMPGALEPAEQWERYWNATRQSLRTLAEDSGGVLLESRFGLPAAAQRFSELVRRR